MNILVVDDDLLACESMQMLLEVDGHETHPASSGAQALAALDAGRFDVVFTDFLMPEMRGDQLARSIRQRPGSPPVVLVSASPPNPLPQDVVGVLTKPYDLEAIRSMLRQFKPASQERRGREEMEDSGVRLAIATENNLVFKSPAALPPHPRASQLDGQASTLLSDNEADRLAAQLRHIRHQVAQSVTIAQAFFELLPEVLEREQLVPEKMKNADFWVKFSQRAHQAIKAIPAMLEVRSPNDRQRSAT